MSQGMSATFLYYRRRYSRRRMRPTRVLPLPKRRHVHRSRTSVVVRRRRQYANENFPRAREGAPPTLVRFKELRSVVLDATSQDPVALVLSSASTAAAASGASPLSSIRLTPPVSRCCQRWRQLRAVTVRTRAPPRDFDGAWAIIFPVAAVGSRNGAAVALCGEASVWSGNGVGRCLVPRRGYMLSRDKDTSEWRTLCILGSRRSHVAVNCNVSIDSE